MKTQIAGFWTSGILFGLMALAQIMRLWIRPDVLVSGHHVPLWPSGLAFLVLAGMCIWMLTLARGSKTHTSL